MQGDGMKPPLLSSEASGSSLTVFSLSFFRQFLRTCCPSGSACAPFLDALPGGDVCEAPWAVCNRYVGCAFFHPIPSHPSSPFLSLHFHLLSIRL